MPRVLYLTHRVPHPPDKGDRIRNYHLLRQLARRCRVWLGCLADEPVGAETTAELNRLCERVAVVPVGRTSRWLRAGMSLVTGGSLSEGLFAEPGLRRVVRGWMRETPFETAVVSSSSLVPYLRCNELANTPAVVDLIDVDSQKWVDYATASRGPKRWVYGLEAARVRKLEATLPGWAKAIAVVSRAEAELFDSFTRPRAATAATNGVDLDFFTPTGGPTDQACVFVGALDYPPNVDAAVWFAREAWPTIRAQWPAAEFRIVGRKPVAAVQSLAALPGVKLVGQVPDVRPHVAAAAVVVAPLRLARGVQNKVLEAMAMAKPVVAAPPALAALTAEVGVHLLSAARPAEWAGVVGGLFADPARCRNLGTAARRFVEENHDWERCMCPLLDLIAPPGTVAV
jgi:sugar transferase (PEP-CTERM/EpsH1 system associated)